ncbi:MAG: tRNA (N(6)-L-threonylcarbamoyladenosine(37)-C(2))-methylthiotransferase MtaB [Beijerinckiaceae bacterium]
MTPASSGHSGTTHRKVEVVNFGCRLNLVESEAMRRLAGAQPGADLVIVNTCAVTAEAARQARQTIRRLKREQPDRDIVVTGCAAQIDPAGFADMPQVARVIGNHEKIEVGGFAFDSARRVAVSDVFAPRPPAFPAVEGVEDHTRAFLAIQNGCDHRCTFCIIPYGRGPSRSAAIEDVVTRAARCVEKGFREIVLTGVDLTSYGKDLAGEPMLGHLVETILRSLPTLQRLRLSSIDCIEADPELITAIAQQERCMPHLHLSLQAGDDLVLKRMKRRHDRAYAVAFCRDLRAKRPDIVFGADLIAGFPTETEAMFENTLALVEDCGLTHLHVFPFSPRPGTPAANMPQVEAALAKDRARRLRLAGDAALARHLEAQLGKRLRVLTERGGMARTEDFTLARISDVDAGKIVEALITGHDGKCLIASAA